MKRTLADRAEEIGHVGELFKPHEGYGIWRPRCSCGWVSDSNLSKPEARTYLNDHFREVLHSESVNEGAPNE